jgi:hypothetical protein
MAGRKQTLKGKYIPENPQKYFGGSVDDITYRSSWEWTCMREFDRNPMVIGWSSETCAIPYFNPFTKKQTVYVPDFVIVYEDRGGKKHAEMIEVKPAKEVPGLMTEGKLSQRDQAAQALNYIKWQAALAFCKKRKIGFRVMTETEIYASNKKKKK